MIAMMITFHTAAAAAADVATVATVAAVAVADAAAAAASAACATGAAHDDDENDDVAVAEAATSLMLLQHIAVGLVVYYDLLLPLTTGAFVVAVEHCCWSGSLLRSVACRAAHQMSGEASS